MEKNHSTFDKTETCESEIDQAETLLSFEKSSLKHELKEENVKKEENKNSMETFCYQFCKDYS